MIYFDDYYQLADLIDYFEFNHGKGKYGGWCRLVTKDNKLVWISWKCRIYESHRDLSPKLFLFNAQILDNDMHNGIQLDEYLIGIKRFKNRDLLNTLNRCDEETLKGLALGLTAKEMGVVFHLSTRAVESRMRKLFIKLNIPNSRLLAIFAKENGFANLK